MPRNVYKIDVHTQTQFVVNKFNRHIYTITSRQIQIGSIEQIPSVLSKHKCLLIMLFLCDTAVRTNNLLTEHWQVYQLYLYTYTESIILLCLCGSKCRTSHGFHTRSFYGWQHARANRMSPPNTIKYKPVHEAIINNTNRFGLH